MRFLSLFSGIEAATVAWKPLGWECVAHAEIDKFPSRLLAHHYPGVSNLGDVTKVTQEDIEALGHIDLVVFGSPCQDLSVAGKRAGLAGERSGLFYDAVRIIRWSGARFALWENVPGAFSSNGGRDFAAVIGELVGAELPQPVDQRGRPQKWQSEGLALGPLGFVEWAVLDAQWFGVAQRRRRVFALADFGDWFSRPPVLLEPESLRRDSPPSRETGEGVARGVEIGPGGGCFTDLSPTLDARAKDGPIRNQLAPAVAMCLNAKRGIGRIDAESETFVPVRAFQNTGHGWWNEYEVATTIRTPEGGDSMKANLVTHALRGEGFDASEDGTGRGTPLVPIAIQAGALRENPNSGPDGVVVQEGIAYTLEARAEVQAGAFQNKEDIYADAYEADSSSVLSTLRNEVGAEAVAEWGSRILDSLQSETVLRSWLHGESLRSTSDAFRRWLDDGTSSRKKTLPSGVLREVWQNGPNGRTSQGRGLAKQLTYELGEGLSQLPHVGAFNQALLSHLRETEQGIRVLRQTLSALQKVRRSVDDQNQSARQAMAVRRLTPVEAERLQGFPEVVKSCTIKVCGDFPKTLVHAEPLNLKSQKLAGHAEESQYFESVLSARSPLRVNLHKTSKLAEVYVEINSEDGIMQLAIPELGWNESVRIADGSDKTFLATPSADFARLIVAMLSLQENEALVGKGGVPPNNKHSLVQNNGNHVVSIYGQEIEDVAKNVKDAISAARECLKYTTSVVGQNSPLCDWNQKTLCSFVVLAMSSCIPVKILCESLFILKVTHRNSYTNIPGAADGPRYKALGNSMAVPVMAWIGRKLESALGYQLGATLGEVDRHCERKLRGEAA